jgi:signal transduction histidine kinase
MNQGIKSDPDASKLINDLEARLIELELQNRELSVLRNLVANAIKFTQPGGGKFFHPDGNFTTPGTEKEQGTGLGLLLCKEFIEKHNGIIWAKSTEGKDPSISQCHREKTGST